MSFVSQCLRTVLFNRGSAETDRNCLGRNSQPQFYAVVAIQALGSLHGVQWATHKFAEGSAAAKRLKNNCRKISVSNPNEYYWPILVVCSSSVSATACFFKFLTLFSVRSSLTDWIYWILGFFFLSAPVGVLAVQMTNMKAEWRNIPCGPQRLALSQNPSCESTQGRKLRSFYAMYVAEQVN